MMSDMRDFWRSVKQDRQLRNAENLSKAMMLRGNIEAWCAEHGITLLVSNDSQHWRFVCSYRGVSWWPSTGTYIVERGLWRKRNVRSWHVLCGHVLKELKGTEEATK